MFLRSCPLCGYRVTEEDKPEPGLLPIVLLKYDVTASDTIVLEEIDQDIWVCRVGQASQFHDTVQICLIEILVQANGSSRLLTIKLFYHRLPLFEIQVVSQCDLIELNPPVRYILTLFLTEGSLALLLILKEQGTLASLRKVLAAANLN